MSTDANTQAVFGAGCFWCVEAVFKSIKGVVSVESGYSGGDESTADYQSVCRGNTDHVEVVKIEFDPNIVGYDVLLRAFWASHDPTTLNRQGADVGTQYRSVVFYQTDEQKKLAEELRDESQVNWENKIVTAIEPLKNYFTAEAYHQDYFALNPEQGFCKMVIAPKLVAFRKKFSEYLRDAD